MTVQKARATDRLIRVLLVIFCLMVLIAPAVAIADDGSDDTSGTPTTPCDPKYMDAIEARAYLEAQREISQNQNLIVKPDSVLQYSCFDSFLNQVAGDTHWRDNTPFSDIDDWDAPDFGNGNLQESLDDVVESAVTTYLNSNFDNYYLGGRESTPDSVAGGDLTGEDYSCGEMKTVWLDAECLNFMDQSDRDGFYDFPWYASNDPREYPDNSQTCKIPENSDGDELMTVNDQYAFNNNQDSYTLQTENGWPDDPEYYTSDPVVTHFGLIMPNGTTVGDGSDGTTTIDCTDTDQVKPIPTGICVVRSSWSEVYADAVCSNPGCHYQAPGSAGTSTPDATDCSSDTPEVGTCVANSSSTTP